jgi:hypothetical protein
MAVKRLHYNKPQLRSMLISAPSEVFIAGRGTGKTVGPLAIKSSQCYFKTMPRGTGVVLNATYTQAFTRTLKELVRGWQMLGYVMNHHFIIGKRPPDKWKKMWKWQEPYAPPLEYKYTISWWNSAIAQIVSQDRPGSSNGLSIDWIIGDEAKLLNEEKYKTELSPANRGLIPAFSNNPYHHGVTFTTDMPVGTAGRWLIERENAMDKKVINEIWQLQKVKHHLKHVLYPQQSKPVQREIELQLQVIEEELNDKRKGLLYYHEASTLDNVHAVGADYIKQQLRDTSEFQFNTQILNLRPLRLEDGFYPDFDEELHGYFAEHEDYFDNLLYDPLTTELDCRKDKDLDPNAPLHIGLDYNRRIHPISVGQVTSTEVRSIKGIHSMYPGKLKQALELFVEYYKPHKYKKVYYWFDHTAVSDEHETRRCDDVTNYLKKNGWMVREMHIGQQPGHEVRYNMWGDLLTGKMDKMFRINRENCSKLILSMSLAEAEQRKDGYGKEKKTERDPRFPADESTHYSDAQDTWVYGVLLSKLNITDGSKGGGGILIG